MSIPAPEWLKPWQVLIVCTCDGRRNPRDGSWNVISLISTWKDECDGTLTLSDLEYRDPGGRDPGQGGEELTKSQLKWLPTELVRVTKGDRTSAFRTTVQRPVRAEETLVWHFECRSCRVHEPLPNQVVNAAVSRAIEVDDRVIDLRPGTSRD